MKTFYTYKGKSSFYYYDVVLAELNDFIVVENNEVVNISKTNKEIQNCPKDVLEKLLSNCDIISNN